MKDALKDWTLFYLCAGLAMFILALPGCTSEDKPIASRTIVERETIIHIKRVDLYGNAVVVKPTSRPTAPMSLAGD